jgi:hypothetical protein
MGGNILPAGKATSALKNRKPEQWINHPDFFMFPNSIG